MTISLDTIKPSLPKKNRKRIGRGNASGTGTYAGKGLKGQKSRSGVSGLKRVGMKQVLLRTPKSRGFNSLNAKMQILKFDKINENFQDSDTLTLSSLFDKKIIKTKKVGVKILSDGELKLKNLKIKGISVTKQAGEKIIAMQGEILK